MSYFGRLMKGFYRFTKLPSLILCKKISPSITICFKNATYWGCFWKLTFLNFNSNVWDPLNFGWKWSFSTCTHFLFCSLGCTIITFMASYENYPSGHALKDLHQIGMFSLSLSQKLSWPWTESCTFVLIRCQLISTKVMQL